MADRERRTERVEIQAVPVEVERLDPAPIELRNIEIPAGLKRIGLVNEILVIPNENTKKFVRIKLNPRPNLFMQAGLNLIVMTQNQAPAAGKHEARLHGRLYQIRYERDGVEFIHPFVSHAKGFPTLFVIDEHVVATPVTVNSDLQLV